MNTVLQMIYDNYTGADRELLVRAYHYAEQAHSGQKRFFFQTILPPIQK